MEWFRSSSTFAKRGTVDREKGAIFGVSVNTVGEAKGHGVHLEQSFVERVAELACEQSWSQLCHVLTDLQAIEFQTSSHLFFKRNEASPELREILKKLAIPLPNSVLSVTPIPEDTPET